MSVKLSVASPIAVKADGADGKTLIVKGFASTAFKDRQGDVIPPEKFDIKMFMKNPQLWIDHQKWMRKGDNNAVPIGVVDSMHAATVEMKSDGGFNVLDLNDGSTIDTINKKDAEKFIVKDGDKGLWVVVKIMEPDVIPYVKDGRYNSFSWSGMIERNDDGRIKRIELLEVSVVAVPANGRALFMLGKNLSDPSVVELRSFTGSAFVDLPDDKALRGIESPTGEAFKAEVLDGTSHMVLDLTSEHLTAAKQDAGLLYQSNNKPVALFKNTWKTDTQNRPVYRLVATFSSESQQASWSKAYVNDLPDEAFAYIAPGGNLDEEGKTEPRSLRHFPIKNMEGMFVATQVGDAFTKLNMGDLPAPVRAAVAETLSAAAKSIGMPVPEAFKSVVAVELRELLNDTEQRLLKALLPQQAESVSAHTPTVKGGDDMTQEELKALTDSIAAIGDTVKSISDRMEKLETKSEEPPVEEKPETAPEPEADKDAAVLTEALAKFGDALADISKRMEKLESAPARSQAATEETATASKSNDEDAASVSFEAVAKQLGAITPDAQKALKRTILADTFIPQGAVRTS